jgi:glucosamine--fructose-6-phosphate aminotransferase (isomerizing)
VVIGQDYTEWNQEEQLTHSLTLQSQVAGEYLKSSWENAERLVADSFPFDEYQDREILLCGCGDSYYAALAIEFALSELTSLKVRAAPSMMAGRYLIPRFAKQGVKPLVIGISASGEVARTIEALELGKDIDAATLAITTNPEGRLARLADRFLAIDVPEMPLVPGLLSYLASLMMGFALANAFADPSIQLNLRNAMTSLFHEFETWFEQETVQARVIAGQIKRREPVVFIGSGSAYTSSLFAAAKVVESVGLSAWANELEEWTHIEYFSEPTNMLTWIMSSGGRTFTREQEVNVAAEMIGRNVILSRWRAQPSIDPALHEILSPLLLWVGPAAFSSHLAEKFSELPFRNFGGGRSREEGGGISRIQTSQRISSIVNLFNQD